jgi:serine/threonine protein kinase
VGTGIAVGDVLRDGRYEIELLLNAGRDKKVYLAHDRDLDCQVALDVFSDKNSIMPNGLTVNAWEARVLGKLGDHRAIAAVLDRWSENGRAFMVTRYLSGGSLHEFIERSHASGRNLSVDEILRIAIEVTSGLEHIHHGGILYLDLQPRNVLFDKFHNVRLVDFDTAVSFDDDIANDLSHRPVITYMAPEVTDGGGVDERADLYSLGVTIYEMCQGRPPFSGSREDILAARRTSSPPFLDRDDLPAALSSLVLRLLALAREQRPINAAGVLNTLERLRAAATMLDPRFPASGHSLPVPDPEELKGSQSAKIAADYAVGDLVDDRFEILAVLGAGGFSKVYRVRDEVEGEVRALKLFESAPGYAAVRREIGALRRVRHPNVVEVFWADKTKRGDWYLITEFIEGESLEVYVRGEKRLIDQEAVDVALGLLDALAALHPDSARIKELEEKGHEGGLSPGEYDELMKLQDHGLVHRDIKPYNVILTPGGPKLLDFNIASRVGDPVHTRSGTPPYQPPDADLTRWDVSPDLFAVGVVLYELLCHGQHPYPNSMPMAAEPVIDPRTIRFDLASGLAEFLIKACAPARIERFSTAAEMQSVLQEARAGL